MDRYDLLAVTGLILLNIGMAAIYWPLAPIITGSLIIASVVYRARQLAREVQYGNHNKSGSTGEASDN